MMRLCTFLGLAVLAWVAQEQEDNVDAYDPPEAAVLELMRLQDAEEHEEFVSLLEETDEETWYELGQLVLELEEVERAAPGIRGRLLRHAALEEELRTLQRRWFAAPSTERESALRDALGRAFDLRQELRELQFAWTQVQAEDEREELEERYDDLGEMAEERLYIALETASPARMRELWIELGEDWGYALQALDHARAESWFALVETDPEGLTPTFEDWEREAPELFARLRSQAGGGLAILEQELRLHRAVLASDAPRSDDDQLEETIEAVVEEGAWPELFALAERMAELELDFVREEHDDDLQQAHRRHRELPRRAELRELIIEAELLRRTEREQLLSW